MKKHVLVVDDEVSGFLVVKIALDEKKYRLSRSKSVRAALTQIQKPGNKIDLIVLDVLMAESWGLALLDKMADLNINIPVIVLSASNNIKTVRAAFKKGVSDFITKPFEVKDLNEAAETALSKGELQ